MPIEPELLAVYLTRLLVIGLALPLKLLDKYQISAISMPEVIPVRFAPLIAGKAPESFEEDIPTMSPSTTELLFINCTSVCDIYSN